MEKMRCITALLVFGFLTTATAQNKIVRKGLISGRLTISPSYMFADKQSYFYLHGIFEGYVSDKISFAGESYYNSGTLSQSNPFNYNHSVFFGGSRHFSRNDHDLSLGIQPGVSFTKLNLQPAATAGAGVNPLFSALIGYNFYFYKLFHFFIQARLILGKHNYDIPRSLSELRFSAGLGFNINTIKER